MSYTGLIKQVPLREIVRLHRAFRRNFFKVPWPKHAPSVHTDVKPSVVDNRFRSGHHFESGVTLSYMYEGEVLNLRRPETVSYYRDGTIQMQLHIRGRKIDDMEWEYVGHIEPDPDEHPYLHIHEIGFRWDKQLTEEVMSEAGIHTW